MGGGSRRRAVGEERAEACAVRLREELGPARIRARVACARPSRFTTCETRSTTKALAARVARDASAVVSPRTVFAWHLANRRTRTRRLALPSGSETAFRTSVLQTLQLSITPGIAASPARSDRPTRTGPRTTTPLAMAPSRGPSICRSTPPVRSPPGTLIDLLRAHVFFDLQGFFSRDRALSGVRITSPWTGMALAGSYGVLAHRNPTA
jgi:hypothetical protein